MGETGSERLIIMPKGSEELTNARKEEIINACASLYETVSFKDITIRDIGAATSFSRTSIYNYFQTKEEIFLALLQREHELWIADLEELIRQNASMSAKAFAGEMAHILEKRRCMLKLMAVNIYDMEENSRLENLVAFKKAYGASLDALSRCFAHFFPSMGEDEIREFMYAFFPFLFGVYPYTSHTEKQLEAMRQAGIEIRESTVYELTERFTLRLLRSFL